VKFAFALAALCSIAAPAHAQKSAMVRCQTGAAVRMVPDYVCDAMLEAFPIISFTPNNQARWMNSLKACAGIIERRVKETQPGSIDQICLRMWQDNVSHIRTPQQ
jgi:hypothetical protein